MNKIYLTRPDAAAYLTNLGLPVSKNTLQKMASLGGGPRYRIFGNRAVYLSMDLNEWVDDRMGRPRRNTSECKYPRLGNMGV